MGGFFCGKIEWTNLVYMKNFIILLMIFSISCDQPAAPNNVFIVGTRKRSKLNDDNNKPIPPPPPYMDYYQPVNFIIDSAGNVYYFKREQHGWYCGPSKAWDAPPDFINLKPEDIIKIPTENIDTFIMKNILPLDEGSRHVAIGSLKDTIQSAGLSKIMAVCKSPSNGIVWEFRRATDEERQVLGKK